MDKSMKWDLLRTILIKVLAIIGFIAFGILLVWLIIAGIRRLPEGFASLASLAESLERYRPTRELSLTAQKSVVNSGESFEVSWTDMKQDGAYNFGFVCTDGVYLQIRGAEGDSQTMECTDSLSLPRDVHGLFVTINSEEMRFTDVSLKLNFKNGDSIVAETETKVTVVNATIPVKDMTPVPSTTPETPKTVAKPSTPRSTPSYSYPASNPNGYIDLAIKTIGVGVVKNGEFNYTAAFDPDHRNVIKFDVKNIGTKTSDKWTFTTKLPTGEVYRSELQLPLKPQEHATFTLEFELDKIRHDRMDITNTVIVPSDINLNNNKSTWSVRIKD
jgi:hypothetical protein